MDLLIDLLKEKIKQLEHDAIASSLRGNNLVSDIYLGELKKLYWQIYMIQLDLWVTSGQGVFIDPHAKEIGSLW